MHSSACALQFLSPEQLLLETLVLVKQRRRPPSLLELLYGVAEVRNPGRCGPPHRLLFDAHLPVQEGHDGPLARFAWRLLALVVQLALLASRLLAHLDLFDGLGGGPAVTTS